LPLTVQWIGVSLILLVLSTVNRVLGALGGCGLAISILIAAASAASAPLPREYSGPIARTWLAIINLLGPPIRSLSRERVKWRFDSAGGDHNGPLNFSGQVEFVIPEAATVDSVRILAALRDALIRRGVAVAETDGFQSYDLELVVPPMIRVPINALRRNDRSIAMLYRIRTTPRRALVASAIIFALLAATSSIGAGIVGVIFAALAVGVLAINRASRIPAIIKTCAAEVAAALGISAAEMEKVQ
jgi:hypothetical protein